MKSYWVYLLELTTNNYKLLIKVQQVDVYLNKLIKIDEQIKLANQLVQGNNRDRKGKDKDNSYIWKQKIKNGHWLFEA